MIFLFTAEIGVRKGLGSKLILGIEFIFKKHWHIGIDPYGKFKHIPTLF